MKNRPRREVRTVVKESSANVLLTGIVCLILGIGIGYFFGRGNGRLEQPSTAAEGPVPNLSTLEQREAALKALLAADPKNLDALVQLGNLYYDYERNREAIDWYGRALDIDPRNAGVRTDRGTCYWRLNQPDAAIAEFQKSVDVDPKHPQALYNMGVVYLHGKNDPEGARRSWQKLLATNPGYPERGKVEQQLNSLGWRPPAAADPAQQRKAVPPGIEELIDRLNQ